MRHSLESVVGMLRDKVEEAGSMRAYARAIGVNPSYLNDALNGHRLPGPAILAGLGLTRVPSTPAPPEYESAAPDA